MAAISATWAARWQVAARVAVWLLALATTISGLILLAQQKVVVWVDVPGQPDVGEAHVIGVGNLGLGLLCVGLLLLGAILLLEALGKFRRY